MWMPFLQSCTSCMAVVRTFLFILLSLVVAFSVSAIERDNDRQLYSQMLEEFPIEIRDFDQTKESKEQVQEFTRDWHAFIHEKKPLPEKWLSGHSWSQVLQGFLSGHSFQSLPVSVKDLQELKISSSELKGDHSIHDPQLYSIQRIGKKISEVAKRPDVNTIIYGGSLERLASSLGVSAKSLYVLPSSYSVWGIDKVFIPSTAFGDGLARMVMVIPPSKQYLLHYGKMFEFLGERVEKLILNKADQREQASLIKQSFAKVRKQIPGGGLDAVILGYYSVFSQINQGDLVLSHEKNIGQGLTVQFVQDKNSSKNYLLIRSDLTIWGESSADIIRGALDLKPRNVIFMGSAGGITPSTPLYSVSVPEEFYLDGKLLPIKNTVYENMINQKTKDAGIVLGGRHGHTNSPIEQTKAYVSSKIKSQITSIDVEQNLIAKTVLEYNRQNGTNVAFGALNLITDKPQSLEYTFSSDADLTKINFDRKSKARMLAVGSALRTLRSSASQFSMLRTPIKSPGLNLPETREVRSCRAIYR